MFVIISVIYNRQKGITYSIVLSKVQDLFVVRKTDTTKVKTKVVKDKNRERDSSLQVSIVSRLDCPRNGKAIVTYRYRYIWIGCRWSKSENTRVE
jgi:hypothetical protein